MLTRWLQAITITIALYLIVQVAEQAEPQLSSQAGRQGATDQPAQVAV